MLLIRSLVNTKQTYLDFRMMPASSSYSSHEVSWVEPFPPRNSHPHPTSQQHEHKLDETQSVSKMGSGSFEHPCTRFNLSDQFSPVLAKASTLRYAAGSSSSRVHSIYLNYHEVCSHHLHIHLFGSQLCYLEEMVFKISLKTLDCGNLSSLGKLLEGRLGEFN